MKIGRLAFAVVLTGWFAVPFIPIVVMVGDGSALGFDDLISQGATAAIARSFGLALLVAAVATPIGAILASALAFGWSPLPRLTLGLTVAPLLLPAFALASGTGLLLLRLHVPPFLGTVCVLVAIATPYTALTMRVAFAAYERGYDDEARVLGASAARVATRIRLPLLAPALARATFLAFLVGWSDYIVTLIVGGGQVITLPLLIASAASGIGNESATALLSLAAVAPPIVLLLAVAAVRRAPRTVQ